MTHLRQRMIEDMGIRNLADNTQSAYLQQVITYAEHFHRSPEELGPEAVRAYQLYLTNTRRLSPSSISVATGALRFLYKVTLKRDWADSRTIQLLLGHRSLATTSRYLKVATTTVCATTSPFDCLPRIESPAILPAPPAHF